MAANADAGGVGEGGIGPAHGADGPETVDRATAAVPDAAPCPSGQSRPAAHVVSLLRRTRAG